MFLYLQIRIHDLLPYSIVAVLCGLAGFVCFSCLPETVNKPTPESLASVIEMRKPKGQSEQNKADLVPNGQAETNDGGALTKNINC